MTRFLVVDEYLRPAPSQIAGEPKYWVIVTEPDPQGLVRYVLIPIPEPGECSGVVVCDLENGFNTLDYLIAHPEIRSL